MVLITGVHVPGIGSQGLRHTRDTPNKRGADEKWDTGRMAAVFLNCIQKLYVFRLLIPEMDVFMSVKCLT
ncbi:hypothetical protein V6N12_034881 [Hibiscus sabdariffa]|uniref:Uncharacterized protein n=1 Tax=Hibiscus sabdariffa TaxID=183260 RepID=A0ABR2BQJ4_9ROSI